MIPAVVLLVVLVVLWVRRRRRRAAQLAGLVAERPTFHVEPPRRSMSARKFDAL